MPKPKTHEDFNLHPGIWCGYVVDEFLKRRKRSLPTSWGGNSTQRYANAVFLAVVCVQPRDLRSPRAIVEQQSNLPGHLCRQIGFAQLFAQAPDFFVEFIQYVRKRGADQKQIKMIARELHFQGDKLLFTPRGEKRQDKEIAAELERKGNQGSKIHPSLIGKARKLLARMKLANEVGHLERYKEFDYNELLSFVIIDVDRAETGSNVCVRNADSPS